MNVHQKCMSSFSLTIAAIFCCSTAGSAATAPDLATAGGFAVLGGTAVTATDSAIVGDVGVDLGGALTLTNSTIEGSIHYGNTAAQQAYDDMLAAYDDLTSEPCDEELTVLSGQTLAPGVYCVDAAATETDGVLTLDGSSSDTWIFRIGEGGTGALTGTNFTVELTSGETCSRNVFWWTAEAATLTDSVFIGSIFAGTSITVTRGSFSGQAMAQAAVTLTATEFTSCGSVPGEDCHCDDEDDDKDCRGDDDDGDNDDNDGDDGDDDNDGDDDGDDGDDGDCDGDKDDKNGKDNKDGKDGKDDKDSKNGRDCKDRDDDGKSKSKNGKNSSRSRG